VEGGSKELEERRQGGRERYREEGKQVVMRKKQVQGSDGITLAYNFCNWWSFKIFGYRCSVSLR